MQLFVKGLDGDTFTVETLQLTVAEVMQEIEDIEGVLVPMQRLIFEGKELEFGRLLEHYKVQQNSTLHLTMDLDGGKRRHMHWDARVLAWYHLLNKQICRKCYGRLPATATRCSKAKCGRTTDIRPKKSYYLDLFEKKFNSATYAHSVVYNTLPPFWYRH